MIKRCLIYQLSVSLDGQWRSSDFSTKMSKRHELLYYALLDMSCYSEIIFEIIRLQSL